MLSKLVNKLLERRVAKLAKENRRLKRELAEREGLTEAELEARLAETAEPPDRQQSPDRKN